MWAIVKFEKKALNFLKINIKKILGDEVEFYLPQVLVEKYKNNKIIKKTNYLLGNHLFVFHKNLFVKEIYENIKFTKGLKYFFYESKNSQKDIKDFIFKCKDSENYLGYISSSIYKIEKNKEYKFNNGPFVNEIFKIIGLQKNKIDIVLGNFKTSLDLKNFNFSQVL